MTMLRDERERGWFHLDNAVIDEYLPKIGIIPFCVYASIVRHADRDGRAFPSYTKLQQELGTGRKQIAAAVKTLVDVGLITVTTEKEPGKQKKNVYRVVTPKGGFPEKLVSERNQCLRETDSGFSETPMVVSQRNSNNTHRTRPIEKDPVRESARPYVNGNGQHHARAPAHLKTIEEMLPFALPDAEWEELRSHGIPEKWAVTHAEIYIANYENTGTRRSAEEWYSKCRKWLLQDWVKEQAGSKRR